MTEGNDKILIVDDDPMIRQTIELMLESSGYSVQLVEGGFECLETLRRGFEGLILMDVMMPVMDGWQTVKAIAEQGLMPGIAICMLTAVLDPDEKMHDVAEYVLDYVRKPCRQEELMDAIQNAMEMLNAGSEIQ